ncbi:BZ3500_MvSof-1268-A1-R1_Chr7-1g09371 [Microbotryum saponariae]|uniref:BZ3500_MvSof-1268-A1-R1_Chr7-1g09371 protein n=1 Tax=Microbotryum saponariae TaxID=289078 RepID=A0A2X0KY12_9BASI|nr:BZ3501_MvSof-1269-A2-R1_Chr7-1g09076 [Microbotryum saponariae]SDA03312.1 BZ3500_MvSof-1268-A1-R1_Chr7-1g09371 [Microbotryum saponariae]
MKLALTEARCDCGSPKLELRCLDPHGASGVFHGTGLVAGDDGAVVEPLPRVDPELVKHDEFLELEEMGLGASPFGGVGPRNEERTRSLTEYCSAVS